MAMYRFFNNPNVTNPINYTCRVDSETGTIIGENGKWIMNATPNKNVNHNGIDGRYIMFIADEGYQFNYFDLASGLTYEPFIMDEITPSLYRVFLPYYTGSDDLVDGTITTRKIEEVEPEEPEPEEPEADWQTLEVPEYHPNGYLDLMLEGLITLSVNGETVNVVSGTIEEIIVDKNETLVVEVRNNQLNFIFDLDEIEHEFTWLNPITAEYETIITSPVLASPDLFRWEVNADNWDDYISRFNEMRFLPFLKFTVRPTTPVEDYPFLKIYKVEDSDLNSLSKEVLLKSENLSGYVNNLFRIPYDVESESELVNIQLKNDSMESKGLPILNYLQVFNLGKILCNHDTLRNISYKNIEFTLFVPNFKPISLDVTKTIERTIELRLIIDLTTGQGTLNLLLNGTVFHIEQEKIGKDIPFRADNLNINLSSHIYNSPFINPYLEVTILNPDNTITTHDLKQRNIERSSLSYIKTDKLFMNSEATYSEQLEIEALLRKGVYVNGND